MAQYFHWSDIPGHIAYAIIAVSYLLTSIFWLRLAAVVGIAFEMTYFIISGSGLLPSLTWDAIFIAINMVQLIRLSIDRFSLRLTTDQKAFLEPFTSMLDKAQIAQLLRTGEWKTLPAGTQLTTEGETVKDLTYICEGQTEVLVRGEVVAHVGAGNFIGDVSFAMKVPATATVVTHDETRVLVFDQVRLNALCLKDQQIASALYWRLGGGLASKVQRTAAARA